MAEEETLAKKKQDIEARIVAISDDVKKGNDTLLEIRESLATSDIFKRNIDDNIRYDCELPLGAALYGQRYTVSDRHAFFSFTLVKVPKAEGGPGKAQHDGQEEGGGSAAGEH
jgi:hypothetical protein